MNKLLISISFLLAQSIFSANSINLMWVNKAINPENSGVFPIQDRNNKEIALQVRLWANLNPDATLYFWYDSEFTTQDQITTTKTMINRLEEYNKSIKTKSAKIVLKDLREFINDSFVGNKQIFSSAIPLYFRVDLLRLMVSLAEVRQCQSVCYSVYSDVDVTPEKLEDLLSPKTKHDLQEKGLVFKGAMGGFENSFHILSNQQPAMLKALDEAAIKPAINMATTYLAEKDIGMKMPEAQNIYLLLLPATYLYFYHLKGLIELELANGETLPRNADNNKKLTPDPINQEYAPYVRKFIVKSNGEVENGLSYLANNFRTMIPTVRVNAPAIKYGYDKY